MSIFKAALKQSASTMAMAAAIVLGLSGAGSAKQPSGQEVADRLLAAMYDLDSQAAARLFAAKVQEHGAPRLIDISGAPPSTGYAASSFGDGLASLKQALHDPKIAIQRPVADESRFAIFFTISGSLQAPIYGLGNAGQSIEISGADLFRVENGLIVEHWTQTDHFALARALSGPTLAVDGTRGSKVEVFKTLPPGTLPESIIPADHGAVLITELFRGIVCRVDASGVMTTVADLGPENAGGPGFIALAQSGEDIYATFITRSDSGIWRVSPQGSSKFAGLPGGASPNGIALDGHGGIIVGDNLGGLWRVKLSDRSITRWLEDPLVSRRPYLGTYPAANGVQRVRDTLYVSNSDKGLLITIPILHDGEAGEPRILARQVPGDDMAVDSDGTAYVTTHPFNAVVEVKADGTRTAIAGSANGIVGSVAAMLRAESGRRYLYVVTDGGAYAPVQGIDAKPAIFRILLD